MSDDRISQLEAELEHLRSIVYFDELTRILNRRGFTNRVEQIFQFIRQHHSRERRHSVLIPFSVIFVDVDNFKRVNDTYSHTMGDAALKHAADIFSRSVRQGDILARFGGEEFVIALHAVTADGAMVAAEKLRSKLAQTPCVYEGTSLDLTASFGVAEYRAQDASLDVLIKRADDAMYLAKQKGKNCVVISEAN